MKIPFSLCLASLCFVTAGCGSPGKPNPDGGVVVADLPSYVVPGTEPMAAIAIDGDAGTFFVNSAASGKIYRGTAGANVETDLELFADFTSQGLGRGGHMAITRDGSRLVVVSAFGDPPKVHVIDVATRKIVKSVEIATSGGGFTALQDVAVGLDGKQAYVSSSLENFVHVVDLASFATSRFALSADFPQISNSNQGFINATGLSLTPDGTALLVVHIIDKHIYRVSLSPDSLGQARQVDTSPYNISGNGLWVGADGELLEVAGDELRVYGFKLNADGTAAKFEARYQNDGFETGLTYAVGHGDRILALNGSGVSPTPGGPGGGGSMLPPELIAACEMKTAGTGCSATVNGFAVSGLCTVVGAGLGCVPPVAPSDAGTGTAKYPIRVFQLWR